MKDTIDAKKIQEKIHLLQNMTDDNARFIVNVLESFIKYKNNYNENIKNTEIILKSNLNSNAQNIIDLDTLWVDFYFNTTMKIKLEKLVEIVLNTPNAEILKKPKKFFKKAIYNKAKEPKTLDIPENQIDIAEFIKQIPNNVNYNLENNFTFISGKIDEEALFKESELKKAIKILKITNKDDRNRAIYDEICSYLKQDFIGNGYCDFIDNKCIAQRHLNLYPLYRKNGCCFKNVRIM